MITKFVSHIKDYITIIDTLGPSSQDKVMLFRGQNSVRWELLPSIARHPFTTKALFKKGDKYRAEENILLHFKIATSSIMPNWIFRGSEKEGGREGGRGQAFDLGVVGKKGVTS